MSVSETETAKVNLLTAEVRTLSIGNRQVTLSVFRQLDVDDPTRIRPFGRVNVEDKDWPSNGFWVVGADPVGVLVRAWLPIERSEDPPAAANVGMPFLEQLPDHCIRLISWGGRRDALWRIELCELDGVSVSLLLDDRLRIPEPVQIRGVTRWEFTGPDAARAGALVASRVVADRRSRWRRSRDWHRDLPLIVLAGLR